MTNPKSEESFVRCAAYGQELVTVARCLESQAKLPRKYCQGCQDQKKEKGAKDQVQVKVKTNAPTRRQRNMGVKAYTLYLPAYARRALTDRARHEAIPVSRVMEKILVTAVRGGFNDG